MSWIVAGQLARHAQFPESVVTTVEETSAVETVQVDEGELDPNIAFDRAMFDKLTEAQVRVSRQLTQADFGTLGGKAVDIPPSLELKLGNHLHLRDPAQELALAGKAAMLSTRLVNAQALVSEAAQSFAHYSVGDSNPFATFLKNGRYFLAFLGSGSDASIDGRPVVHGYVEGRDLGSALSTYVTRCDETLKPDESFSTDMNGLSYLLHSAPPPTKYSFLKTQVDWDEVQRDELKWAAAEAKGLREVAKGLPARKVTVREHYRLFFEEGEDTSALSIPLRGKTVPHARRAYERCRPAVKAGLAGRFLVYSLAHDPRVVYVHNFDTGLLLLIGTNHQFTTHLPYPSGRLNYQGDWVYPKGDGKESDVIYTAEAGKTWSASYAMSGDKYDLPDLKDWLGTINAEAKTGKRSNPITVIPLIHSTYSGQCNSLGLDMEKLLYLLQGESRRVMDIWPLGISTARPPRRHATWSRLDLDAREIVPLSEAAPVPQYSTPACMSFLDYCEAVEETQVQAHWDAAVALAEELVPGFHGPCAIGQFYRVLRTLMVGKPGESGIDIGHGLRLTWHDLEGRMPGSGRASAMTTAPNYADKVKRRYPPLRNLAPFLEPWLKVRVPQYPTGVTPIRRPRDVMCVYLLLTSRYTLMHDDGRQWAPLLAPALIPPVLLPVSPILETKHYGLVPVVHDSMAVLEGYIRDYARDRRRNRSRCPVPKHDAFDTVCREYQVTNQPDYSRIGTPVVGTPRAFRPRKIFAVGRTLFFTPEGALELRCRLGGFSIGILQPPVGPRVVVQGGDTSFWSEIGMIPPDVRPISDLPWVGWLPKGRTRASNIVQGDRSSIHSPVMATLDVLQAPSGVFAPAVECRFESRIESRSSTTSPIPP
jgi:hypothetical protein